jgi:hypothetical protein
MRKLLTSSIFILMFSLFSGAVLAGDKGVCDENEYGGKKALQKAGVYGLCVAYQNADDADKPAIADKFFQRFGFVVPGFSDVVPGLPPEQDFFCPCLEGADLELACSLGAPITDSFVSYNTEGNILGGLLYYDLENGGFAVFDTSGDFCAFGVSFDGESFDIGPSFHSEEDGNPLLEDDLHSEQSDCRAEIEAIYALTPQACADMGYDYPN